MLKLVQNAASLLAKPGMQQAHVVGHDFGSPVAAYAALTRGTQSRLSVRGAEEARLQALSRRKGPVAVDHLRLIART